MKALGISRDLFDLSALQWHISIQSTYNYSLGTGNSMKRLVCYGVLLLQARFMCVISPCITVHILGHSLYTKEFMRAATSLKPRTILIHGEVITCTESVGWYHTNDIADLAMVFPWSDAPISFNIYVNFHLRTLCALVQKKIHKISSCSIHFLNIRD